MVIGSHTECAVVRGAGCLVSLTFGRRPQDPCQGRDTAPS